MIIMLFKNLLQCTCILIVTQEKEKYLIQKFYVLRCCNEKVLYLCGELTHSIFFPLLLSIVWKI